MTDLIVAACALGASIAFYALCYVLAAAHRVPPPRSWS